MDWFRILFEFIPVILALVAIPTIVNARKFGRDPTLIFLAATACALLIIAQTGWIQALLTNNSLAMTMFDHIWTVFNSVVMLTFIKLFKRSRQ